MADALRRWLLPSAQEQLAKAQLLMSQSKEPIPQHQQFNAHLDWRSKAKRVQVIEVGCSLEIFKNQFLSVRNLENPTGPVKIIVSDKFNTLTCLLTEDCIQSLGANGKKLTHIRGGIVCLTKYKFQVHPGRVLGLHLVIDGMGFKGSEGSSTFGDPEDLNLEKGLQALLNAEYHNECSKKENDQLDLLLDEMNCDETVVEPGTPIDYDNLAQRWKNYNLSYENMYISGDQKAALETLEPRTIHAQRSWSIQRSSVTKRPESAEACSEDHLGFELMSDTSEELKSTQQKSESAEEDTQKEENWNNRDYQSQTLQTQYFAVRASCSPASEAGVNADMKTCISQHPYYIEKDPFNIGSRFDNFSFKHDSANCNIFEESEIIQGGTINGAKEAVETVLLGPVDAVFPETQAPHIDSSFVEPEEGYESDATNGPNACTTKNEDNAITDHDHHDPLKSVVWADGTRLERTYQNVKAAEVAVEASEPAIRTPKSKLYVSSPIVPVASGVKSIAASIVRFFTSPFSKKGETHYPLDSNETFIKNQEGNTPVKPMAISPNHFCSLDNSVTSPMFLRPSSFGNDGDDDLNQHLTLPVEDELADSDEHESANAVATFSSTFMLSPNLTASSTRRANGLSGTENSLLMGLEDEGMETDIDRWKRSDGCDPPSGLGNISSPWTRTVAPLVQRLVEEEEDVVGDSDNALSVAYNDNESVNTTSDEESEILKRVTKENLDNDLHDGLSDEDEDETTVIADTNIYLPLVCDSQENQKNRDRVEPSLKQELNAALIVAPISIWQSERPKVAIHYLSHLERIGKRKESLGSTNMAHKKRRVLPSTTFARRGSR